MQILYLKHGQTTQVESLQTIFRTWISERKSLDTFYKQINTHMKTYPPSLTKSDSITKNILAIRQQLVKDFEARTFKTKSK